MTEKICPLSHSERVCGAWCKWALPLFDLDKKCYGYDCELLQVFLAILQALVNRA